MSSPTPSTNERLKLQASIGKQVSMQKPLRRGSQQHRESRMHDVQQERTHQDPSTPAFEPGRRYTSPLLGEQNTSSATRAQSAPPSEAKMAGQKEMSPISGESIKQWEHRTNDLAAIANDSAGPNVAAAPAMQSERVTAIADTRSTSAEASSHSRSNILEKNQSEAPGANLATAPFVRDYAQTAEAIETASSSAVREDQEAPGSETDRPFKRIKSDVKSNIAPWMTERHKRAIRRSLEAASLSTSSSPATSPAKEPATQPAEGSEQ